MNPAIFFFFTLSILNRVLMFWAFFSTSKYILMYYKYHTFYCTDKINHIFSLLLGSEAICCLGKHVMLVLSLSRNSAFLYKRWPTAAPFQRRLLIVFHVFQSIWTDLWGETKGAAQTLVTFSTITFQLNV